MCDDGEVEHAAAPRLRRGPRGLVNYGSRTRKSASPPRRFPVMRRPSRTHDPAPSTARSLGALDVETHLRDPARKQAFVTPMFDIIAPRYDAFTRSFSFGMDAGWKRALVDRAASALPPRGVALDVACGTGDLAGAVARRRPEARVTGIDASPRMIELATGRADAALPNVSYEVGDIMRLPAATASADLVTAGYALRNVPDWRAGLAELARVLRPGGHLVTLDFYRPESRLWRAAFLAYLRVAGDVYGLLWHGEPVVYGYIARSIAHFASWQEFSRELARAGFRDVETRVRLLGGVVMHAAVRAG
jgi:demethylmenaquinone methyltransferase/2-methoxy-6-polyprenyl-1,4-benzoquinol methylase